MSPCGRPLKSRPPVEHGLDPSGSGAQVARKNRANLFGRRAAIFNVFEPMGLRGDDETQDHSKKHDRHYSDPAIHRVEAGAPRNSPSMLRSSSMSGQWIP